MPLNPGPTPSPAQRAQHGIRVTNWRPCRKNTLQAFLTLNLPSGLVIHNCGLHEKNTKRWISFPARQYKKEDGSAGYKGLIEFADRAVSERFQTAALAAVDRFLKGGCHE
jgi:hypothetical protein